MIVTMSLELSDRPGELLKALKPIAEHGGNIVSVVHHRGNVTPRGTLPVEITFEIVEERLDNVVDDLRERGVHIAQLGEEKFHESVTVVLVGHIVRSDISDTIKRIEQPGAKVVDISLSMPEDKRDTSSARLTINATGEETMREAMESVRDVCEKKELLKIDPVEVEGSGARVT